MPACGPSDLKRFFLSLLSGDPDNTAPSARIKTLVDSFSQDVIYAVTCGQQKPPKHYLLAYGIKTLTGNVELIRMVNKLGHGVSYDTLEENDTALCLQKLAVSLNQRVALPRTIKPSVFTNLAWDNIDRIEETLTGEGTSHRVNGIAVQPKVFGPHLPIDSLPAVVKSKKRTVTVETQQLPLSVSGERVGPQPLQTLDDTAECQLQAQTARKKDLLWILIRLVNTKEQTVPAWTGFNVMTREKEPVQEDVVGYLPTINAPATEMATVQEILIQSDFIRTSLNLDSIVVVFDQALYAKAAEIVWKHKDKYKAVVLRLGAFHTIMVVLSILGKRFEDTGLRDLCIESGIVAEGSVTKVFEGKLYKRGVRTHKCILEALMRMIWQCFIPRLRDNHTDVLALVRELEDKLSDFPEDIRQDTFNSLLEDSSLNQIFQAWEEFLQHLRHENGDLSAFWMTYVDLVQDVLLLARGG